MTCIAMLEHRIDTNDRDYLSSGNLLLDRLFGCKLEYRKAGLDMNGEAEAKGAELRAEGEAAYVIPGGGSNTMGALGYVSCAHELGAAGRRNGASHRLHRHRDRQRCRACRPGGGAGGDERPQTRAGHRRAAAQGHTGGERLPPGLRHRRLGMRTSNPARGDFGQLRSRRRGLWHADGRHGQGCAPLPQEKLSTLLDPIYSGKAMPGMIDLIRKGELRSTRRSASCTPAARWACSAIPRFCKASRNDAHGKYPVMRRILTTHTGSLPRPAGPERSLCT
jgi:L-cysteate sulfo-lyase